MSNDFDVDTYSAKRIEKLAFGSCNNQRNSNMLWQKIASKKPDVWLWIGDAVYSKPSLQELKKSYQTQLNNLDYQTFLQHGMIVDGVYDDHDFGGNDVGSELEYKEESQAEFLRFINVSTHARLIRRGAYSSHLYGPTRDRRIKVIMLDTRYHRDAHFIPSVAMKSFPSSGLVAAISRWFAYSAGWERHYKGDILGKDQWKWLERQLLAARSEATFTILVSSIQVLSTNPLIESWGHFPAAKRRLYSLIEQTRAPGLILLSGDVHFAEISGTSFDADEVRPNQYTTSSIVEITSSGLTHSCTDAWYSGLIKIPLESYASHRIREHSIYLEKNFGLLKMEWNTSSLIASIHNANGKREMEVRMASSFSMGGSIHPNSHVLSSEDLNMVFPTTGFMSIALSALMLCVSLWIACLYCKRIRYQHSLLTTQRDSKKAMFDV